MVHGLKAAAAQPREASIARLSARGVGPEPEPEPEPDLEPSGGEAFEFSVRGGPHLAPLLRAVHAQRALHEGLIEFIGEHYANLEAIVWAVDGVGDTYPAQSLLEAVRERPEALAKFVIRHVRLHRPLPPPRPFL